MNLADDRASLERRSVLVGEMLVRKLRRRQYGDKKPTVGKHRESTHDSIRIDRGRVRTGRSERQNNRKTRPVRVTLRGWRAEKYLVQSLVRYILFQKLWRPASSLDCGLRLCVLGFQHSPLGNPQGSIACSGLQFKRRRRVRNAFCARYQNLMARVCGLRSACARRIDLYE